MSETNLTLGGGGWKTPPSAAQGGKSPVLFGLNSKTDLHITLGQCPLL